MDFQKIEEKWKKKWEDSAIFQSEPDDRKKFYITVAYPYPSGGMHVGHVRTYTVPDIVARFKRMQGYNVLFPIAWHVTGTPIIGAVSRLKKREKKQIDVFKNVFGLMENDFKKMQSPMEYARFFIDNFYVKGMKDLGYSIDWRRQFTTNDPHYKKFIEWQHGILYSKGLQKQGLHPVKWCLQDKNPVTTHDILEGEDAEIQEFTLLKFKYGSDYLVAATLRPETIYGQTNLWVKPDTEYVKVRVGKETWIVSRVAATKLEHQKKNVSVIGKVKGKSLLGKYAIAPGIERSIMILPSEFCDPNMGTGIVTSVPSDAPYDYIALYDLQKNKNLATKHGLNYEEIKKIKPIPIISTKEYGDLAGLKICIKMGITSQKDTAKLDEATKKVYKAGFHAGKMTQQTGDWAGMPIMKAKELIKKDLISKGKADVMYEFSEPVVCRCGGMVVVANTQSWFIDYTNKKWNDQTKQCLKMMKIVPTSTRRDYEHTIDWLQQWPCIRNYGLGTPLPQDPKFIIEPLSDSTIYMAFYLIAHKITGYPSDKLKKEFFDYVMTSKGSASKVAEITGIPAQDLEEMKASVSYWYPMDWRTSANDLIQNHLTFMIFHHTAIFPLDMWPKGIAVWGMGLMEGGKMSSSKGNVVLIRDAIKLYGADTVRFFLMSSVEPWQDFDWRAAEVEKYKARVSWFYNKVLSLSKKAKQGEITLIDKWLLSEVHKIIKDTTKSLEGFQTRKATLECFFRMSDVIRWYERRAHVMNKDAIDETLWTWVKLMTPFTPFAAEELWEQLGMNPNGLDFVSVAEWPKHNNAYIDEKLNNMEGVVKQTMDDISVVRKLVKKKTKKVNVYVAPEWKRAVYDSILKNVDLSQPNKVIQQIMKNPEARKQGNDAVKFAQNVLRSAGQLKEVLSEDEEYLALKGSEKFFTDEAKCDVKVIRATQSKSERAKRSEPGKPGIEVVV